MDILIPSDMMLLLAKHFPYDNYQQAEVKETAEEMVNYQGEGSLDTEEDIPQWQPFSRIQVGILCLAIIVAIILCGQ